MDNKGLEISQTDLKLQTQPLHQGQDISPILNTSNQSYHLEKMASRSFTVTQQMWEAFTPTSSKHKPKSSQQLAQDQLATKADHSDGSKQ
ncbi:hypothetical protein P7K49_006735 [Saguinus oedipus]|uniref:Uncharacterized protein n=1 Tax=Saguinus oedipus TaxID=9490 RepID=A0ABQ9W4W2_SAGOE|nr:hypothetical protein P7K49_006735 [Saguinus oedipus]